jgi:hypothetical protein
VSEKRIRCWLGWVASPLGPYASPVQEALYSFMHIQITKIRENPIDEQ